MKDEKIELVRRRNDLNLKLNELTFKSLLVCGVTYIILFVIAGRDATIIPSVVAIATIYTVSFARTNKVIDLIITVLNFIKNDKIKESKINTPSRYKLLKLSEILFSAKTQKEVFLVTMGDWDEEVCQALKENKDARLFMINVRHTYAFLMAIWKKTPLGDLVELIRKVAK